VKDQALPGRAALLGFAAGVGSSVCVGLLFVVQKDLLQHLDPATLNGLEMIVAAAISGLAVASIPSERRLPRRPVLPYLALFTGIACIIFYTRNVGVQLTSATTGAVVIRTEVAMVMLLSYLVLHVKPGLCGWGGAALLFVGAVLSLGVNLEALRFTPWGTVALFLSAAGIAVNALIIKTRFGGLSDAAIVLSSAAVQSVVFGLIILATGTWPSAARAVSDPGVLARLVVGGAFIFGALYLYYRAMKLIPMWVARTLSLLVPPIAMLGDYVWLGSAIAAGQIYGLVAVTVGAALVIPCLTRNARNGPPRPHDTDCSG
jgi:drug/metabolite transporter (DMT)-like permease